MNKKLIVIFLALLVLGMSVAVAADADDSTSTTKKVTKDTTKIVKNTAVTKKATKTTDKKSTKAKENIKTKNTTEKTITKNTQTKSVKRGVTHEVNNTSFDQLFTANGLASNIGAGDTLNFTCDISRTLSNYTVDKAVNINGNGHTLDLNTVYGYNLPSLQQTKIDFNSGASNSNITNLKFHNTQVFTTSASNIVFDHINSTVDQGVGMSTGYFAMRNEVFNITVKNSYFHAVNNTGCSAIVITLGEKCTIDNNTVIGEGTVGNLIYLNRWGAPSNPNGITENKNNTISNNKLIGPEIADSRCNAITIGGPHNHIINNTINYTGIGITGNWAGTYDPATNTTNDYYNLTYTGNGYINNTLNNGASFSGAERSLIAGNNFTGTATISKNSTVTNNKFNSTVTLKNNINFKNNNAENSTLYVNGSNCDLCNDTVNTIVLKSGITNISICFDMFGVNIEGNTSVINWYSHPSSLALTKKLSKSLKSVKSDGEPQVIDITEENYSTYFRNNTYNSYMMSSVITTDTIFNLYYVPENINQFQILNLQPYHLTFVGKNNLTIRNVKFQTQGSNLLIKDINVIYEDVDFGNVFIGLGYASQGDALPLIWDNITINISNYDEDKYDGGTLSSPIRQATASSGQKNIIVRNSVINANLPATNGNSLISVSGISFINNSINLNETMGLVDSPSLIAMDLTTESGVSVVVEGNNITVLGKSNLVGIKFNENIANSNITNNNITVTSTEGTANGVEINGNDNTVTDNTIYANDLAGDAAVVATGENNVVQGNGPIATELTVINPSVVNVNEISPMTVILKDAKGNLLANQEINVTVGDESETISTDSSGIAVYDFLPTTSGSADIVFNSISDGMFLSSNKTVTVTVNEDKDAIIEELNKTIQEQKETIASNEEDIEDLNNIIEEQDDEIEVLTNTTQALNNTVAQLEQDIKDVQEQIANNNNTNNGNGTSNKTSTPTKTSVTVKLNPKTIYTGSKTKITATLKDANGKAVASQKISIKVGTKTYTVKTNKKGVATKTVKVTKTGKNKVTATFKATKKYAKATKTSTLTVKAKEKTKITVSKLSYKNKKIIIKATIKAGKKALTQNTKLTIKVDGKTLTSKKISKKGKISLTLKKALKKGSHKVQIISKATSMYKQSKVTKTLKI